MIAAISPKAGAPRLVVVAVITFFCEDKNEKFCFLQNDLKIVQPVSQIPFKGLGDASPTSKFVKIAQKGKIRENE